jgi:hypothetical protein
MKSVPRKGSSAGLALRVVTFFRCKYAKIQVLIRYFARVIPASLDTVETLIAANMKGAVQLMSLAEIKYVVFPEHELTEHARQSVPEILRRWLVKCPQCAEVRLVVGARENERYVCKDCGHSFTVRLSVAANDDLSNEGLDSK